MSGFRGLEVGVVPAETGVGGDDVVGEKANVGVVGLNGIVVTLAGDGDAIFGTSKLVLKAEKIFVGLELRIIFGQGQDFDLHAIELIAGGDLVRGSLGVHVLRAGLGDVVEDGLFLSGISLDGFDQVGDEIGAALEVGLDLRPVGLDSFVEADHLIAAMYVGESKNGSEQESNDEHSGDNLHGPASGGNFNTRIGGSGVETRGGLRGKRMGFDCGGRQAIRSASGERGGG